VGADVVSAHHRAVVFEHRCAAAWQYRLVGGGRPLPDDVVEPLGATHPYDDGSLFAAMARHELRTDPGVLGRSDRPTTTS
jgi:L-fuculose-phosphate aldolase